MDAVSSSIRSPLMAEPSLFDMFGRTSPRIRPTLNSHSRMMEARLGKQTGLRHRGGCKMNLTKRTKLRRIPDRGGFIKGAKWTAAGRRERLWIAGMGWGITA